MSPSKVQPSLATKNTTKYQNLVLKFLKSEYREK